MGRVVIILLVAVLSCPVWAQKSPFLLEDVDASSYPSVRLTVRDKKQYPLERENFLVRESSGTESRTVLGTKILRKEGVRPIHVVFLVQSGITLEENNSNTRFLQKTVQSSGEEDRFSFVFFSDDLLVVEKDLDRQSALSKAKVPGSLSNRNTGVNLDLVFQKLNGVLTRDSFIVLLLSDSEYSLPRGIRQGLSTSGLPIQLVGKRNFSNFELIRIYGGEFYDLLAADSQSRFLSDLEYFRKHPAEIRYESPFREDFWKGNGEFLRGDWESIRGGKFNFTYKPGTMKRIRFLLLSPGVFLPTIGFLLILTLIGLLLLFRREGETDVSGESEIGEAERRFHARGEEREVYQRMYGDQFHSSPYAHPEQVVSARSLPVYESEFESAEAYDLATLIQKEGR
ncbi:hypothetical protein EHQ13_04925, partial [Leptospira gomenensis]